MTQRVIAALVFSGFMLCFSGALLSQEGTGFGVQWNGYLQTDHRLRLKGENEISWHEYRLDLKLDVKPAEKAHFYGEFWLRTLGFSTVQNSTDLAEKDKIAPTNLDFREAYVDIYGFLDDNLDLRIGRQRIAWGTADQLNPTDNLNPDDLEDIWDFGRHLGSDGLLASYYLKDYTFSLIYIPIFTPAVLPRGDWASALSPSMQMPAGLTIHHSSDSISLPKNNLKESSVVGAKLSKDIFGYDFSLSYVYGRDDLPLARKVVFTPAGYSGDVDIASELYFPRMHIAGIDLAGEAAGIGVWAEAAVFFPEKVELMTDLSALGMGITESIALDDKPYVKYVIGADYTFKNGIYVNSQFFHGFIHERGRHNMEDYFMFALEWRTFDDKLKIIPIGGGVEMKDIHDIKNNYAVILSPEIVYCPIVNAEITLGARWIEGKNSTTFGKMKDYDELYLRLKYSF